MSVVILRRRAVREKTGLCSSTIYQKMSQGKFPRPVDLGPKSVGWLSDEIDQWIEERRIARDRKNNRKG